MTQITLDQEFVQTVVMMVEQRRDENGMKGRLEHTKVGGPPLTHPSYQLNWSYSSFCNRMPVNTPWMD
jgi:hypothetical protein